MLGVNLEKIELGSAVQKKPDCTEFTGRKILREIRKYKRTKEEKSRGNKQCGLMV